MNVNFVSEMTAFNRWIKSNSLSVNSRLLWFQMFLYWNEVGFPDWLQVDIVRLMGIVQVNSKNTVIRARDDLVRAGLLISKRGKNKEPNKYQFVLFSGQNSRSSFFDRETGNETGYQTGSDPGGQTGHLYKLNKDKPNNKKEKKPYGEFEMVHLTDEELLKLQDKYPDNWEDWIKRVDRGKAMKGYKYKNDYAGILSWIDKEEKEETQKAFNELMAEAEWLNPHYGIYQNV